ncbi:MAG TPA: UpxY family transcription antiterminator [Chitinophagaceae bacterium]|nr:UpxY family transcription antiterminator [Chitinophagaceae bacterium]
MQNNWYIIYTREGYEKKVSSSLNKKKIENFFPQTVTVTTTSFRKTKHLREPLFKGYVFVNTSENYINTFRQIDGVISLVYWMGKPAIVPEDEIEAIKEFTNYHQNIELEKTQVVPNGNVRIIDGPSYFLEGNILALRNKDIKVHLPSLGYTLIVKLPEESIFSRETTILQNNSFSHS